MPTNRTTTMATEHDTPSADSRTSPGGAQGVQSTSPDAASRAAALDPTGSFVVQAPAGSGKTTLLTQRYLVLLAHAERPEEILAITFTRKAAAEMRHRILEALGRASRSETPKNPGDALSLELARNVLARSDELGWHLLEHPSRLRVQTIDSLNQWLAQRLPVLSRAGSAPTVHDAPRELYEEAARRVLTSLELGGPIADRVALVLLHLDNDSTALAGLLADMLARRDHWLRLVAAAPGEARGPEVRRLLEANIAEHVTAALERVRAAIPDALGTRIVDTCRGAARRLAETGETDVDWSCLHALVAMPDAKPDALTQWQRLADLMLTQDGDWRQRITKTQGFPTHEKAAKQAFIDVIADLGAIRGLDEALDATRGLPPTRYTDEQWNVLDALIDVLLRAAAELELVFAAHGRVDFVAVSRAALQALGQPDDPSELALVLDYRIRHLLVDEFQDTSQAQVQLLDRLTAGWEPGDGRTLFCVGDPMQSIYRFREADVALFLRTRDHGLGPLHLRSLVLEANFRSKAGIVDWVNATFPQVMPAEDDLRRGAVRYAHSVAMHPVGDGPAVVCHGQAGADEAREAARVVDLVSAERRRDPDAKIAILARARTHLVAIARALQAAGLRYQGLDLVPLADRLAVRDLVSLTRAFAHLADRGAWLACLRAPWCGLELAALHALVADAPDATVHELLHDDARLCGLGSAERSRLARFVAVADAALAERGRRPLAVTVESAWIELGGPATVRDDADLANVRTYLERLDRAERAGDLDDPAALDETIEQLFAAPDAGADDRLQLMTIHRAKGLEWDVVIVPGLGRAPAGEDARLLRWMEFPRESGGVGLVLAPVKAKAVRRDPLENWLRSIDAERTDHELRRLLYVAATRARRRLNLLGHLRPTGVGPEPVTFRKPQARSALAALWPAVGPEFEESAREPEPQPASAERGPRRIALLRLVDGWRTPSADEPLPRRRTPDRDVARPELLFDWVTSAARHAGTVVHEELERAGRLGIEALRDSIVAREGAWRRRLVELGLAEQELDGMATRIRRALTAMVADERGRWLFDPSHRDAVSELALTAHLDGRTVSVVVDRTFVDDRGVRWIVDFKTSAHEGGDLEGFLDRERQRHARQLETYARVMRLREPARELRLGLYFPLYAGWRDWSPVEPA
jgi:ATP-dependent helicase/nuclease subunit A